MFNGSYYSTLLHVTILKGGYTAGECWMGVQTNSNILFITNGSRRAWRQSTFFVENCYSAQTINYSLVVVGQ